MKSNLLEVLQVNLGPTENPHCYVVDAEDFEALVSQLVEVFPYLWLIDIVYYEKSELSFLKYNFCNVDEFEIFEFEVFIPNGYIVSSIDHLLRRAHSHEKEIMKSYNILFSHISDSEKNIWSNEFDVQELEINFQDHYKMNYEKLNISLEDSLVKYCKVDDENYHIGLERILKKTTLKRCYQGLEAYYPLHSSYWSTLISKVAEESTGVEISDRAKAIRMVLMELTRVMDHVVFLKRVTYEFKMIAAYEQTLLWIKRLQSLFISYTGNEYGAGTVRFGGVMRDINEVWLTRTVNEVLWLERSIQKVYSTYLYSESVKAAFSFRLVSKKIAANWNLTGPLARAVGINLDFRKLDSIYFYNDIDFEVPVGVKGTGYDLLLVRVEEILQSLRIIGQVLDNLPTGPIMSPDVPFYIDIKNSIGEVDESLYRSSITEFLNIKDIKGSGLIEGGDGLYSIDYSYGESNFDYFKLGPANFCIKDLFERIVKGSEYDRVMPLWTVLNVNFKEVER